VDVNVVSLPTTFPWAALITAIATLLGVGLTLLITTVTTNSREAKRLQHEQEMKLREDRQKAYATMARITKGMDVDDPLQIDDLAEAHSEIEMLTEDSQVLDTAEQVLHAAHAGRQRMAHKKAAIEEESTAHSARRELAIRGFEDAKKNLDKYRTDFINVARKELGRGPRPSPPSPTSQQGSETTSEEPETPPLPPRSAAPWWQRWFGS